MENNTLPTGAARLELPVSITEGVSPKILNVCTLKDVLDDIPRQDASFAFQMQQAAKTDKAEYDRKKSQLFGFIGGKWSERKAAGLVQYVPYIILDIDKITDDLQTARLFTEVCLLPFTLAAFRSPSGRGLRIIVFADNDKSGHAKAYAQITHYYSDKLGVPTDKERDFEHLDTSAKALPRFWYYSFQPSDFLFVNPNADTFCVGDTPLTTTQAEPITRQYVDVSKPTELTVETKIHIVSEMLKRRRVPTGRNNYVFHFSALATEHGVPTHEILNHCLTLEASDFPQKEISATVESAVNRTTVKYTDEQIKKYLGIEQPKTPPSVQKPVKNGSESKTTEGGKKVVLPKKIDYRASGEHEAKRNENKFLVLVDYLQEKYDFRFNEVANKIEISLKDNNKYEELNVNSLTCELLAFGLTNIEKNLAAYLGNDIYTPKFDVFKDFFENFLPKWDGKKHIDKLASFVETENNDWWRIMFRKAIMRTAACSLLMRRNKQCLVLFGGQDAGKSHFLQFLVPPQLSDFYKEGFSSPENKDGRLEMVQNMIINLDDLDSLGKWGIGKMKALFTIPTVKERLPFGKSPVQIQRRASFWASSNKDNLLEDETGNVRWVIIPVKSIRHDFGGPAGYEKNVDILQVWAEAYSAILAGEKIEMTHDEITESERNNKGFEKSSYEQEILIKYYEPCEDRLSSNFFTASEIKNDLENILGLQNVKMSLNLNNIGSALAKLKIEKITRRDDRFKYPVKGYFVKKRGNLPFFEPTQDTGDFENLLKEDNGKQAIDLPF